MTIEKTDDTTLGHWPLMAVERVKFLEAEVERLLSPPLPDEVIDETVLHSLEQELARVPTPWAVERHVINGAVALMAHPPDRDPLPLAVVLDEPNSVRARSFAIAARLILHTPAIFATLRASWVLARKHARAFLLLSKIVGFVNDRSERCPVCGTDNSEHTVGCGWKEAENLVGAD